MQEVYVMGDVNHALVKALKKAVRLRHSDTTLVTKSQWKHDVVVDCNLTYNSASVAALARTRARTLAALQRVVGTTSHRVRYIHVICDGSTHDVEMVTQFQRDYGIHACVIDLGVLHGPHTPSKIKDIRAAIGSSNGVIRFVDSSVPLRCTSIGSAVDAILYALEHGTHGVLHVQDQDQDSGSGSGSGAAARVSIHADNLSRAAMQPRRHFMFFNENNYDREHTYLLKI